MRARHLPTWVKPLQFNYYTKNSLIGSRFIGTDACEFSEVVMSVNRAGSNISSSISHGPGLFELFSFA